MMLFACCGLLPELLSESPPRKAAQVASLMLPERFPRMDVVVLE